MAYRNYKHVRLEDVLPTTLSPDLIKATKDDLLLHSAYSVYTTSVDAFVLGDSDSDQDGSDTSKMAFNESIVAKGPLRILCCLFDAAHARLGETPEPRACEAFLLAACPQVGADACIVRINVETLVQQGDAPRCEDITVFVRLHEATDAGSGRQLSQNEHEMIQSLAGVLLGDLRRRVAFGIMIEGTAACVLRVHSQGAQISKMFDVVQDVETTTRTILSFVHTSYEQLGWDITRSESRNDSQSVEYRPVTRTLPPKPRGAPLGVPSFTDAIHECVIPSLTYFGQQDLEPEEVTENQEQNPHDRPHRTSRCPRYTRIRITDTFRACNSASAADSCSSCCPPHKWKDLMHIGATWAWNEHASQLGDSLYGGMEALFMNNFLSLASARAPPSRLGTYADMAARFPVSPADADERERVAPGTVYDLHLRLNVVPQERLIEIIDPKGLVTGNPSASKQVRMGHTRVCISPIFRPLWDVDSSQGLFRRIGEAMQGLGVIHKMGRVHGDVNFQNISVSGGKGTLTDYDTFVMPPELAAKVRKAMENQPKENAQAEEARISGEQGDSCIPAGAYTTHSLRSQYPL
ncbi:hypothetical protein CONPUDRAFT_141650 [Coniophora puteana RWD-64-598 SS2]|uniref:Fungal-type protein kinase domain-containing protein n=1 Tax=Coniophora puteana (strain RWD-64-598) TaxID=741705 RepID=A0A5M3N1J6_CONPW|nr:uncharacterized protein CONPUDRAFT_141650 [Coniophora puteana RWD-64-598 SS2]EIW84775.1 hypothetical protein CONPUDRAFT_141650 [Coniophora puteana RWD-64-598 SS2]